VDSIVRERTQILEALPGENFITILAIVIRTFRLLRSRRQDLTNQRSGIVIGGRADLISSLKGRAGWRRGRQSHHRTLRYVKAAEGPVGYRARSSSWSGTHDDPCQVGDDNGCSYCVA
jgi:hypothetical protein